VLRASASQPCQAARRVFRTPCNFRLCPTFKPFGALALRLCNHLVQGCRLPPACGRQPGLRTDNFSRGQGLRRIRARQVGRFSPLVRAVPIVGTEPLGGLRVLMPERNPSQALTWNVVQQEPRHRATRADRRPRWARGDGKGIVFGVKGQRNESLEPAGFILQRPPNAEGSTRSSIVSIVPRAWCSWSADAICGLRAHPTIPPRCTLFGQMRWRTRGAKISAPPRAASRAQPCANAANFAHLQLEKLVKVEDSTALNALMCRVAAVVSVASRSSSKSKRQAGH